MRIVSLVVGALLIRCCPAIADDADKLLGTWKVVSAGVQDVQSKGKMPLYGDHPSGYLVPLPSGDRIFKIISDVRRAMSTG